MQLLRNCKKSVSKPLAGDPLSAIANYQDPEDLIWDIMQGMIAQPTDKPQSLQTKPVRKDYDLNEQSFEAKIVDGTYLVANAATISDPAKSTAFTAMEEAIDLDEMVCQSICAVESPELRKKLASNIILVGGVAKTDKLVEWLEDSVFNRIRSAEYDDTIECVEVILVNLQQQQQVLLQQQLLVA